MELICGDVPYKRLKGLKERNFGIFEGESEDLNPRWENGYDDLFPHYGGETSKQVAQRMLETCTNIMREDNQIVLAVSHAGACLNFLTNFMTIDEIRQILQHGTPNCTIFKYEFENDKFRFIEVIIPQQLNI